MGHFVPIPVRTSGRFGPIPFRSGRFSPILEVSHFGPILVGHFGQLYFIYFFLGNTKFFLLAQLILCSYNKCKKGFSGFPDLFHAVF